MLDTKKKAFIFLSIAFLLALLTASLFLNEVRKMQSSIQTVTVAVVKQEIPTYTAIESEYIEWVEIPRTDNLSAFVTRESELEQTMSIVNLKKGDFITKNILRSTLDIQNDHRVVWLNATNNVVMDQPVTEGDLVEIIITFDEKDSGLITKITFEEVMVVQRVEREGESDVIKISLPLEDVESFIHYQHTADRIRVLLANQVQQSIGEDAQYEDLENEEETQEDEIDEEDSDVEEEEDDDEEDDDE